MATPERGIRPKEREAMEHWESLPEADRTYANVADMMRPKITEGRAGVYVRDALRLSGKEHLLPQRGRRSANGGNAATMVEEDSNPIHDIERMLASVDERVKSITEQVEEVRTEADSFDPEAAVTAEQERLAKIVAEAQADLDKFSDDDVQAQWASRRQGTLNDRKVEVEKTAEKRLATLEAKKSGLEQIIALVKDNPQMAEMFASTIDDDEADDPESLTNDPSQDEADTDDEPAPTDAA